MLHALRTAVSTVCGSVLLGLSCSAHQVTLASTDSATCVAPASAMNPVDLYGEQLRFSVWREGKRVGAHTVTFKREGDWLSVQTEFTVTVAVLSVPLYRYEYRAEETLHNGCLQSLVAETNDNGSRTTVSANVIGDKMIVSGPRGMREANADVLPTHHWRGEVVNSTKVLNTITGEINSVRLVDKGTSSVTMNQHVKQARHYQYLGDLTNEVWYDSSGRWVKMQFRAKDGSIIEYRCEVCARDLSHSAS